MRAGTEYNCLNLNEASHLSVRYGSAGALQSAQGGFTHCVQSESVGLLKWERKHETNPIYVASLSFRLCWHEQ